MTRNPDTAICPDCDQPFLPKSEDDDLCNLCFHARCEGLFVPGQDVEGI